MVFPILIFSWFMCLHRARYINILCEAGPRTWKMQSLTIKGKCIDSCVFRALWSWKNGHEQSTFPVQENMLMLMSLHQDMNNVRTSHISYTRKNVYYRGVYDGVFYSTYSSDKFYFTRENCPLVLPPQTVMSFAWAQRRTLMVCMNPLALTGPTPLTSVKRSTRHQMVKAVRGLRGAEQHSWSSLVRMTLTTTATRKYKGSSKPLNYFLIELSRTSLWKKRWPMFQVTHGQTVVKIICLLCHFFFTFARIN